MQVASPTVVTALGAAVTLVAAAALPTAARAERSAGSTLDRDLTAAEEAALLAAHPGRSIYVPHPGVVVPEPGVAAGPPPARILYLNDCKPDGCRVEPGRFDDARIDQSSIIEWPRTLSPYRGLADSWTRIVECVEENFAPFTIRVVTEDPGDVPHFEVFVAGTGQELGYPEAGGVASYSCGVIPNAVSFAFANLRPNRVSWLCAVISQEAGHNFGLAHEMLATDAMTYIPEPERKRFVDQTACVGTQGCCQPMSECRCGQLEQNSFQRLVQAFGAAGMTGPDIFFDQPFNGAIDLLPGFAVEATVTDWDGVAAVEVSIDGAPLATLTAPPWALAAPADLAAGEHVVALRATDALGFTSDVDIEVTVIEPCRSDDVCAGLGPGWVCGDDGRCGRPPPAPEDGGCRAGGAAPLAALWLAAPLGLLGRRRRRRRAGAGAAAGLGALCLAALTVALPARAAAETAIDPAHGARGFIFVRHPDATAPEPGVAYAPPARILYLNDCKPDGCRIVPGDVDDSRLDQSMIIELPKTLSPYTGSAETWAAIVQCVRENFAPFEIRVVTEDPGDVPHFEAIAAGTSRELGISQILGVASFSCGIIPNAMSFSFLNELPDDVLGNCWTISQESGHNFGLSHSMLAADAMTYIGNPPRKRFVDQSACIGTQGCCLPDTECRCGLLEQNSFQRLLQVFSPAGMAAPDIWFDEPTNDARGLFPGFPVRATVSDFDGVASVELLVDDASVATLTAPPWAFTAPATLAAGSHRIVVSATDRAGFTGQTAITVEVVEPCRDDAACASHGAGWVCGDDGRCAPPTATPDDGGCRAGGAAPLAALLLAAPAGLLRRRRRAPLS